MSGFLFVITVLFWGSTWIAIKFQLTSVAPEVSLVYRFGAASIIFFFFAALKRQRLKIPFKDHQYLALLGVLMFGMNYLLTYWAAKSIPSGLLATIFALAPVVNILFELLFFGRRIEPFMLLGAIVGASGIAIIFWPELANLTIGNDMLFGLVFCLCAIILFSLGSMVSVRNHAASLPVLTCNAYGMAYGALFLALFAIANGKLFTFDQSFSYIASLSYLIIVGTVLSFLCFLTLMARIGPSKAAYTTIFFPMVALLISTLFENFQWTTMNLLGVMLALSSSLFVMRRSRLSN
ncbi:MAG: DMT family transporter [Pseudomonadales bacterium]|nr:DMT family transporter [Pseudomonadales bacterium]